MKIGILASIFLMVAGAAQARTASSPAVVTFGYGFQRVLTSPAEAALDVIRGTPHLSRLELPFTSRSLPLRPRGPVSDRITGVLTMPFSFIWACGKGAVNIPWGIVTAFTRTHGGYGSADQGSLAARKQGYAEPLGDAPRLILPGFGSVTKPTCSWEWNEEHFARGCVAR